MRLLVVEDDPDLLAGLLKALAEEGYAVDGAAAGPEGLYKAETWDYDAMVLDAMLPGLDGWEVLRRLRPQKATPVLMLTARDAVADRVRGLDAGADDYLTKPFDLVELCARLRALIRRSCREVVNRLTIGELSIDLAAHSVATNGTPVALTATEYALLEYLALHRGEVISRTTLYDHLFDEAHDSLSNLLDVHVANLRRKIGRDVILTRRGHGYLIA